MTSHTVSLTVADEGDLLDFKRELQEAFAVAVIGEFGELSNGPIPSDEELDNSIKAPEAVALRIVCDGKNVGGAVVTINEETQHNTLAGCCKTVGFVVFVRHSAGYCVLIRLLIRSPVLALGR